MQRQFDNSKEKQGLKIELGTFIQNVEIHLKNLEYRTKRLWKQELNNLTQKLECLIKNLINSNGKQEFKK